MKLYISADIEGIAGVASRDQGGPGKFEYDSGRAWMTAEVRAACEGAVSAGATEIVISDSHGNGQNLDLDALPDDVRVIRSWPRPLGMMEGIQEGGFDAAMLIGYHAGATNPGGNLAHTIYGLVVKSIRINGQIASEAYLSAVTAGDFDVPVVLISGDDVFVEETAAFLPESLAVTTKRSLGTLSVESVTPSLSQSMIRVAAHEAMGKAASVSAFKLPGPVTVELEFKHRMPAELLSYLPVVDRVDAFTVSHEARDLSAANRFLSFATTYEPTLL